jgi:ubiquinone/menaquinone biosynthesis C-methylase UbiE
MTTENDKFVKSSMNKLMLAEHKANQEKIIKLLKGFQANNYLDIGCREGEFTLQCANSTYAKYTYGIEIDKHYASIAQSKGIQVKIADAGRLFDYPDRFFNLITANQVLEHVVNTDVMISECYRALSPKGVLLISVPNLCSFFQRMLVLSGNQPTTLHVSEIQVGNFLKGVDTARAHLHAFSVGAIIDLLKYHKFKIDSHLGSGFYPLPSQLSGFAARLFPDLAVYTTIKASKC